MLIETQVLKGTNASGENGYLTLSEYNSTDMCVENTGVFYVVRKNSMSVISPIVNRHPRTDIDVSIKNLSLQ